MTYDSCTRLSYILQNNDFDFGELFVEYINLDNSCRWNGLQRGYFVDLFKSTIKINSLRLIERKEYKNYEFSTYIIDEKYYLNIVYGYMCRNCRGYFIREVFTLQQLLLNFL